MKMRDDPMFDCSKCKFVVIQMESGLVEGSCKALASFFDIREAERYISWCKEHTLGYTKKELESLYRIIDNSKSWIENHDLLFGKKK